MVKAFAALVFMTGCCLVLSAGQEPARGGRGAAVTLPDGNGRDLVQATCTKCHGLNLITNSWGYTRQGWESVFSSMVDVPAADPPRLAEYLATNFPEKPRPRAVVIPGSTTARIREWSVPSLGS